MFLDMGEEEDDTPIILGRPFLNTTNTIIYIGFGQVHFQFLMSRPRSPTPEGDADHPNTGGINSQGMDGKKMKNLKNV
jgi:hypothetical protein